MSPRPALLLGALVLLLTGCADGTDDEMAPQPRVTVTATPTTTAPAPLPDRVPVGEAGLDPLVPVWAQGSVLHVGERTVDVSPRRVDALVATPGGIYFLDDGEVWFTDLSVVRATGLTGITRLAVDADRSRIRVDGRDASGRATAQGYDATTGARVPAARVRPAGVEQRLGRRTEIVLRTERSDVSPSGRALPARMGTGKYGLVDVDGGPLVVFDTTYDLRRPLTGVVGTGFELVAWTGPATFYGLALVQGRPTAVLGCDAAVGSCRTFGRTDAGGSLLFEPGS